MRFEATTTPRGVSLRFTKDGVVESLALGDGEIKRLSVHDGIALLVKRLNDKLPPAPKVVECYEIDDEDDADLSIYEEEVEVDW